jgi:hypothetical protein
MKYLTPIRLTHGGSSTSQIRLTPGGSSTSHIWLTLGGSSTSHIRLTPGGSSTSHIYTQTVHKIQRKENLGSAGRAPSLRVIPLAFALQLRKKHGKTSVRVAQYKNNKQNNTQKKNSNTAERCHRTIQNTEYTTERKQLQVSKPCVK